MKTKIINYPDLVKALDRRKSESKFDVLNLSNFDELSKLVKGKKYFIRTYGCQANIRDEETMRGMLENLGYSQVNDPENADLIIINTCAVRENAEDKVYGEIGNLKRLRKINKNLILAICGCMVEQPEILQKVMDMFPEVNLFFGTHEVPYLYDLLLEAIKTNVRLVAVESKQGEVVEELPVCRNNTYKAFVNIIYGCNKFCSYCIVPYTRGKERSRKYEDVIKECQTLVDNGYQEITLLGQNVNAYGKDLNDGSTFAKLLEQVAKIGIPRVRFLTSHPWDFTSEIIDVIAKYDNIMKYIHLPVQSGSDEILRLMGRRYTREKYLSLAREIKEKIPNVALTTDIIVGFPNETYEQFLDTVSLCREVHYDSAFTFIYSPRNNTPAAKIKDNVTAKEKSKRFRELVKVLEEDITKYAEDMVGKTFNVLVEGPSEKDPGMLSGYTEKNKLIHFKGGINLVGKIVKVKILESHTYSMIGELVNE